MCNTTVISNVPRVWIGCLNCYNNGFLVGDWFCVDRVCNKTVADVHRNSLDLYGPRCEELWCLDSENLPVDKEMSLSEVHVWRLAYVELASDLLWPAYCAWIRSGAYVEDADGKGCIPDFEEAYAGEWDSFREFAEVYLESSGLLENVPEEVTRYFDFESFARDLQHDYIVMDAPGAGVYVFRSL